MITISGRLFGRLSLGTIHVRLGIDLPVYAFSGRIGIIDVILTTGPREMGVPSHSVQMVQVEADKVREHEEADPKIKEFLAGWD